MRKRKSTVTQRPRRVFLVICEGETEKTYVETLKRHYRLPIAIKTKVSGNAISERLVKRYLNELDLRAGDDFEVFYIYDSDVKSVAEKICSLPGIAILTNPCIELWFLLHLKDHRRHIESEEAVKALAGEHSHWKNYAKGKLSPEQRNLLIENRHKAADRAKILDFPRNPSSNMHEFITQLEKALKG